MDKQRTGDRAGMAPPPERVGSPGQVPRLRCVPRPAAGGLDARDGGFGWFWDAYPRKVGRADAERAWAQLDPDPALVAEVLAGLARARQSRQWAQDRGRYIPNPANWLRGRRWEDVTGVDFTTSVPGMGTPAPDPDDRLAITARSLALVLGRDDG